VEVAQKLPLNKCDRARSSSLNYITSKRVVQPPRRSEWLVCGARILPESCRFSSFILRSYMSRTSRATFQVFNPKQYAMRMMDTKFFASKKLL